MVRILRGVGSVPTMVFWGVLKTYMRWEVGNIAGIKYDYHDKT
jgi:hypothetical protein